MSPRLKQTIAWIGVPLGLALLGIGLFIEDTAQWRLQLLTGLWLLSLLPRALLDRSASRCGARHGPAGAGVRARASAAVALQLAREQVSQAAPSASQAAALLQPATAQEPDSARRCARPTAPRLATGGSGRWQPAPSRAARFSIAMGRCWR